MLSAVALVAIAACNQSSTRSAQPAPREPECHLIPSGHIGNVLIVYDQEHGSTMRYRDGTCMIDVPADGTVITRARFQNDTAGAWRRFYYVDAAGAQTPLREIRNCDTFRVSDGVCVYGHQIDSISTPDSTRHLVFESYLVIPVGSVDTILSLIETRNRQLARLAGWTE
ncbi:MAG TPA: hypothetical protein VHI13_16240 [Candidatus Kapabacteria bacterium]|nr:hypothetical protein [Candidatus Kapabacteria bacterium]